MSPTLETFGQALFGSQWQRDLARALGVNDRTIRRWYSGATPIPDGAFDDMRKLCRERARRLELLAMEKTDG